MKECLPPFTPSPKRDPKRGWAGDSRTWFAALVVGLGVGLHLAYPGGIAGALPHSMPPPAGLGYFPSALVFISGVQTQPVYPTVGGGPVVFYRVQPALPEGLRLDPFTGTIAGTPSRAAAPGTYQVTASNEDGSTTCRVTITVAEPFRL